MSVLNLTPEQWQTVERGLPLPVQSPTNEECVLVQKKVFDRMQKILEVEEIDPSFFECEDSPLP
jgi:hypothetical protein